jgi:hypothetical protein
MVSLGVMTDDGRKKWEMNCQFFEQAFPTLEKIVNQISEDLPFSIHSDSNLPCLFTSTISAQIFVVSDTEICANSFEDSLDFYV